jgi:hypothetical protein
MTTTTALIIAAVVIAVALVAWLIFRKERSKKLRNQFGPEYSNAIQKYGNPTKAEDALLDRQKRIEKLHIHSLQPEERDRFAEQWHQLQSQFVDDPSGSIEKADQLVCDVMSARGYPMSEFERRADDLSVDHPHVVANYRAAHDIALRRDRGQASTEDSRQAFVHYRDLFDELLEAQLTENRINEKRNLR